LSIATRHGQEAPWLADPLDEVPPDPMPPEVAALRDGTGPLSIFAYGSLIWDAEFNNHAAAEPALLYGYHRSFCLYSYDYRGTREEPGLTLGLDRGGSCRGMVLHFSPDKRAAALDRLWSREMTAPRVYDLRPLSVHARRWVGTAWAFTVRRGHPDYVGRLPPDAAARLIAGAVGRRGTCRDYFDNTFRHLAACGIIDAPMRRLAARVTAAALPPG
jgi:cation transport protein ChaC